MTGGFEIADEISDAERGMSENVVAMPGVTPRALDAATNADAIAVLEEALNDFRSGKYVGLMIVATSDDHNWMRESASTCGHAIKMIGLARVLLSKMEGKIANSAWPDDLA